MPTQTSLDPFALLDLTPCANLDLDDLESRYLRRSRDAHPDRFSGPLEDALALQSSLNEAYRTLSDPWSRFAYLVEFRSPGLMEAQKRLDPMFLAEAMEAHEDALESLADDARRDAQIEATKQEIENTRRVLIELLDDEGSDDLDRAATLLHQVRYAQRRLEALTGQAREL